MTHYQTFIDSPLHGNDKCGLTINKFPLPAREKPTKKMLKYAKRTQFIGLSIATTCYMKYSQEIRQEIMFYKESSLLDVSGGSSDPPHPGRSEDLPGTVLIEKSKIGNEAILICMKKTY